MKKLWWIALLLCVPLFAQDATQAPIEVSVADLSQRAEALDGRLVRVQAVLVFGWEGDNFLVEPARAVPLTMPSRNPASVWFYCKPGREAEVYNAMDRNRVVYGTFEGYFHYVREPKPGKRVFEPGPLQFEAVVASIPAEQPRTLAAASVARDVDAIRRILASDTTARDKVDLNVLLSVAAEAGRADFIEELVAAGADPKSAAADGESLLQAAWSCRLEAVEALLAHGMPVNAADRSGQTALILASQTCKDGRVAQLLLEHGADANARTKNGVTALMAAERNPRVVEKLLAAGADPRLKSEYGDTVESESCDRGAADYYEVCQLVRAKLRELAGQGKPNN